MNSTSNNLKEILEKLKHVNSVFRFGERMLPVVEGFVTFLSDFTPLLEQIGVSIEDSRSKIPEVANQINNVTNATELAMTEVLDKIDEITLQLNTINDCITELVERKTNLFELTDKLKPYIKGDYKAEKILSEINENIDIGLTLELVKNKIVDITLNTDQITMALQVQDITAQQLAAVNHLIISLQHKLGKLLAAINDSETRNDDLEQTKNPDIDFDSNATYNPSNTRQEEVDLIIKNSNATQAEIDKLFS